MKIGILFNCQGQGIAAALQALLPGCTVTNFHVPSARADARQKADDLAALLACDHVISAPMGADMGPFATDRLRMAVKNFHILPPLDFRGFHPDTIYIRNGRGRWIVGPTGDYQSRIAVAGYLAGLAAEDVAALYNGLVFARLGYLRSHAEDYLLIEERFCRFGIDTGEMVARLRSGGCFMHSVNHPKNWVLFELARIACRMIGATPVDVVEESAPDFLALHPRHPLFPEIAHRIDVPPEGEFRAGGGEQAQRILETVEFVRGSFTVFREVNRDLLRQADGVAAAMASLDLTEAGTARGAAGRMALLTSQGTLLHVRGLPGAAPQAAPAIIHLPVGPLAAADNLDTPLLCLEFDPASLPVKRPELGGIELLRGFGAGQVAIIRNGAFLGIDPATSKAAFGRDAAGDCEQYLPVPVAELEPLRALFTGPWQQESEPAPLKLPPARMDGFQVQLGDALIDLRRSWPRVLPPNQAGDSRLAVLMDGVPVTLRGPKAKAVAAAVAAKTPVPQMQLGRRLAMVGAHAWLHLPLTVSTADRLWLHERCGDPKGLPWEEAELHIEVRRDAGRLVGAGSWRDGEPALAADTVSAELWPSLASPCALIEAPPVQDGTGPAVEQVLAWIDPLMRLLTLVPHLPAGAALLAPRETATEAALTQLWQGMGLQSLPWARLPAPTCVARDLTWADAAAWWQWPAEALRSVRSALLGDASPGRDHLVLRGPQANGISNWAELERVAKRNGYATLDLAREQPAAILARLRQANRILGAGGDLLVSVFCPPGTKVIELSADKAFRPAAWRQSCALGLPLSLIHI